VFVASGRNSSNARFIFATCRLLAVVVLPDGTSFFVPWWLSITLWIANSHLFRNRSTKYSFVGFRISSAIRFTMVFGCRIRRFPFRSAFFRANFPKKNHDHPQWHLAIVFRLYQFHYCGRVGKQVWFYLSLSERIMIAAMHFKAGFVFSQSY